MDWVVAFIWLQLKGLIADDTLGTVCVVLHKCIADCKITCISDHMKWSVLVCNRQNWRAYQALLDTFK